MKKAIQETYEKRYHEAVNHEALMKWLDAITRQEHPGLKELGILRKLDKEEKHLHDSREQILEQDAKEIKTCQKHVERCESRKKMP